MYANSFVRIFSVTVYFFPEPSAKRDSIPLRTCGGTPRNLLGISVEGVLPIQPAWSWKWRRAAR
jgi:hypothetical protein